MDQHTFFHADYESFEKMMWLRKALQFAVKKVKKAVGAPSKTIGSKGWSPFRVIQFLKMKRHSIGNVTRIGK